MTIADEKWRSPHGNRIAEIGPIPVTAGIKYSAEYLEAIFTPARAGDPPIVIPEGLAMRLTAVGTEERRGVALILHDSSKRDATVVHNWTAKRLCGNK
jgi:hypothetical protein